MPTKTAKKSDNVPLMLRLPPELHAGVVRMAAAENKSMNEYIIKVLSEYPGLKIERDKLLIDTNKRLIDMDRRLIALEARGEAVAPSDIPTLTIDPADFPPGAQE